MAAIILSGKGGALLLRVVTNQHRHLYAVLLLAIVIFYYFLDNFFWGPVIGGLIGSYILRPLAWAALALLVIRLPGVRPAGKLKQRRFFLEIALVCGIIAVLGSLVAGVLGGFGKSPYNHSPLGILTNVIFLATYIWGMESARAWLLNHFFKQRPVIGIVLTGLFFSIFWFPFSQVTTLDSGLKTIEFAGNFLIPAVGESMLCSYLAFLGGPIPPLVFRAIVSGFHWLSPILPAPSWVIQTLIGTFVPVICMVVVYESCRSAAKVRRHKQDKQGSMWDGVFSSAVAIILIWFSAGAFSIFPAVVVSGSMLPTIKIGDMIIVKKVDPTTIEVGDIIQFKQDKIRIVHRVIDIERKGSQIGFVTKGDNNSSPDGDLVLSEQVTGRLVLTIPKAGALSMLIRSPDRDVINNMADIVNGDSAKGGRNVEKP